MTYRIHRSATPSTIIFTLSGELDSDHAVRLQELLANEENYQVVLDLKDVTLVTRSAVQFLARVEETGIRIDNCPAYVRRWIIAQKSLHEPDKQEPHS